MRRAAVFLLAALMLFLFSCAEEQRSAVDILSSLMADIEGLPAGRIYIMGAKEGEDAYYPQSLSKTMYGERAEEMLALCEDMAIYLSESEPYEIAVFKCYSASDAERISTMCMKRAETLRVLLHNTEWAELADSADIRVSGRVVTMAVTGDA